MQTATKTCLLLISAIGLAGCDGPAEPFAFATTYTSFASLETAVEESFDPAMTPIVNEDGTLVDNTMISKSIDFGASGTTTYTGAILAQEADSGDGRAVIGQLQLDVAFDTSTMVGHAGNFFISESEDGSIPEVALNGTLTDDGNGSFDRLLGTTDEPHFTGMSLSGALSGPNAEEYNANITLEGYFLNAPGTVDAIAGSAVVDFGDTAPDFEEGAFAVTD
ncbi:MAG: hypothetical protein ACSHXW_02610 [Yoonia sp.]